MFTDLLTVSTFNCKNVKTSLAEVQQLCDKSDIVFLQETWLTSQELHILTTIDSDFHARAYSAMDVSSDVL